MKPLAGMLVLLFLCVPVAAGRDDPDLQRLAAQLTQLEADPLLGTLADGERVRAHQALTELAQAHSWQREHLLYLAERRVATAQFAAEAELAGHRLDQLDREHDRILLAASRRDAERARADADRLELQNQAREEAAQRAQAEQQAQAQVAAGIAEDESEQTQVLAGAHAREAELARQEAALRSGMPATAAGSAHDLRGTSMTLPGTAFAAGRASLRAQSRKQLQAIAALVQASPAAKVRIEGHTDNQADAKTNLTLSQQRADAVRMALIAQGVAAARIQAVGLGAEQPVAANTTAAGRARNRRVEVVLLRVR